MKHKLLFILIFIFINSRLAITQTDKVDDYIKAEMQKRRIPGLTLAVVQNGKIVKQTAYGLANVELNVPTTIDTVYQIASTTKTFTATAIMTLVEEGKLSLDDKLIKILPELPANWGEVTVRHCLTHTSGLPNLYLDECSAEPIAETRAEALTKLATSPILSKPGEQWNYNDTGYLLLGMIIEKLSGMTFEEFLQQRFFLPLGMTTTRFGDYKEIFAGRASLYTKLELCRGQNIKISRTKIYSAQPSYLYKSYTHAGAGINTTVGDLVKWNLALDEAKIVKAATLDQMWTVVKLNDGKAFRFEGTIGYANGWEVDDQPGHKSAGHSGGVSTGYRRYVDDRLTVIILTNLQGADPDSLIKGVATLYIPELAQQAK
ncbi:MAG: serine hydrolase domain-containing protein [Acidobacteriota bacterium]